VHQKSNLTWRFVALGLERGLVAHRATQEAADREKAPRYYERSQSIGHSEFEILLVGWIWWNEIDQWADPDIVALEGLTKASAMPLLFGLSDLGKILRPPPDADGQGSGGTASARPYSAFALRLSRDPAGIAIFEVTAYTRREALVSSKSEARRTG
jgi:hypothetical protein